MGDKITVFIEGRAPEDIVVTVGDDFIAREGEAQDSSEMLHEAPVEELFAFVPRQDAPDRRVTFEQSRELARARPIELVKYEIHGRHNHDVSGAHGRLDLP